LSNTWVHQYHNDNARSDTSKVTRQKVDAIVAKTSDLVVYHSVSFVRLCSLIEVIYV
jgi:hypothetical protein